MALHKGAEVFSTGTGAAKLARIEGYGARPIDYRAQSVADYVNAHTDGAGFDMVFDTVGGQNMANSFAAAALNGDVVTTVALLEMDLSTAHFRGLSLHVVFMLIPMLNDFRRETHGAILAELARLIDAGAVTPLLDDRRFGLGDVDAAYAHLKSGKAIGKVVIEL
nr:zinc-binding dehydrogenase [Paracoccus sp. PARArs4]